MRALKTHALAFVAGAIIATYTLVAHGVSIGTAMQGYGVRVEAAGTPALDEEVGLRVVSTTQKGKR